MFSSLKSRILLAVYIFILISIPIGAYLATNQTNIKSSASENTATNTKTSEASSSGGAKALRDLSESASLLSSPIPEPSIEPETSTIATSFGPTLSLKVNLEGRKEDNQKSRLFVGIVEGTISINPKFLLSFTVDLPASGAYSNISLAGLTPGTNYTALLKGSTQIASAAAFVMSPTVSSLNGGGAIKLTSGDLNDDNIVNSQDYSIVSAAMGATSKDSNWNESADINYDGIVNILDLSLVNKNFGKIGDSGAWTSPLPTATSSARLAPEAERASLNDTLPIGSAMDGSTTGYWLWIPR